MQCMLGDNQLEMTNYQDIYCENKKLESTFLKIKNIINTSNNQSISYYSNEAFINELSLVIAQCIVDKKQQKLLLEDIKYLFNNADYRIVADYINALNTNKSILKIIRSHSNSLLDYQVSRQKKIIKELRSNELVNLIQKYSLPEMFTENGSGIYFYAKDENGERVVREIYNHSDGHIMDYIEQQRDLPGMFSLVRSGLVKKYN